MIQSSHRSPPDLRADLAQSGAERTTRRRGDGILKYSSAGQDPPLPAQYLGRKVQSEQLDIFPVSVGAPGSGTAAQHRRMKPQIQCRGHQARDRLCPNSEELCASLRLYSLALLSLLRYELASRHSRMCTASSGHLVVLC